MNTLNFSTLKIVFENVKTYIASKSSEWAGRVVITIKDGLTFLEDPRMASLAVVWFNFGILELAKRINQYVSFCISDQVNDHERIKTAVHITVSGGLFVGGNIAFIKATGINLNPFVILAIAATTFVLKHGLDNCIKHQTTQ